jgi:hypothetical protein
MLPTYRDGDLLLALYGIRPRSGRTGLVDLPPDRHGRPRPLSVKRLSRFPQDTSLWEVASDNAREGVSAAVIGPLPASAVRAAVLVRMPRLRRSRRPGAAPGPGRDR